MVQSLYLLHEPPVVIKARINVVLTDLHKDSMTRRAYVRPSFG